MYPYQEANRIECYSDTDWAGCQRTRKSTSGGCLMLGNHMLKTWSSTQPTVSLSSGEAEFYGVVRASGIALGQQSLMRDLGHNLPVRVWTDSSSAIGTCSRQGLGKLRHIETHTLWIQEKVRSKAIELRKVRGDINPADLFTKHLASGEKIQQLLKLFGCEYRSGRAACAPHVKKGTCASPGGDDECEMYNVSTSNCDREAAQHDPNRLPHSYEESEINDMFPCAESVEELMETKPKLLNETRE